MLRKKQGFPEEKELVRCTVTKIHPHGVFVTIEEYGRSGMIHISEISPGRIRNIRDYVKEDKVIICSVLRVNKERGYIDLSLRRVSESQRRRKVDEIKQEQKAEKIIEQLAKEIKIDNKKLYDEIIQKVLEKYNTVYDAFEDVVVGNTELATLGIDKTYCKQLDVLVKQRIKPPIVSIKGKILVQSYEPNGVEVVKKALQKAKEAGKDAITIRYLGAGKFSFEIIADEYKEAETVLKDTTAAVEKSIAKTNSTIAVERFSKKN
jgi:translation initiation factor 2 subunit 1